MTKSNNISLKIDAIKCLGDFKVPMIVDRLLDLLDEKSAPIKTAAVYALGMLKNDVLISKLSNVLENDVDSELVLECVKALENIVDKCPIEIFNN